MPELPEVETIKLGLKKYLVGHTIEDVEVHLAKQIHGDASHIIGQKVIAVRRFGKGLVIDLSNNYSLAIHIKLTGQLIYRNQKSGITNKGKDVEAPNKFTHVVFKLDHGASLYYNDIRQFGWIKIIPTSEIGSLAFFKELGPEPPVIKATKGQVELTEELFAQVLLKARTPIKVVIMDQKKMSGVGNIYANDALYLAKIDPKRPANSLNPEEVKNLYKAILTVLKKGLEEGGASELTFVNALGEKGNYQNHSLVYGKAGQKCKRDGTEIKKFTLGGRGTYFCPTCQK